MLIEGYYLPNRNMMIPFFTVILCLFSLPAFTHATSETETFYKHGRSPRPWPPSGKVVREFIHAWRNRQTIDNISPCLAVAVTFSP
jgi:hypothetical protein